MTKEALKVVPIEEPKKQEKPLRARIERVTPAHIVDCWKLLEASMKAHPWTYPDVTEVSPHVIRSHLFEYISKPHFMGFIAKVGRRPVGQFIGEYAFRPIGAPQRFWMLWNAWVESDVRKNGVGKLLGDAVTAEMKNQGVFHWEANVEESRVKELLNQNILPGRVISVRIGGKR